MQFIQATKKQRKLRLALIGPSGSGKTYTALSLATAIGGPVAVFDTENGSASLYSDEFPFMTPPTPPADFSPDKYIEFLRGCEAGGVNVAVLDGLSAAWAGKGGILEMVDNASRKYKGNSFAGWKDATPEHNRLLQAIISCKVHVIATARTKTEWVVEENDRGQKVPRKIGTAPVQRDGLDYEFDVVGDMDHNNCLIVTKSRCKALSGKSFIRPGKDVADILKAWLEDGDPASEQTPLEKQLEASIEEQQEKAFADLKMVLLNCAYAEDIAVAHDLMAQAWKAKKLSRPMWDELDKLRLKRRAEVHATRPGELRP